MKKTLLGVALLLAACADANAQSQRLVLFEEFSGENCPPCAAYNPGLWSRVSAAPTKTLLIKYQVPIPSAGPIYNQNPTFAANRGSYYSVPFAPYGRADGSLKFVGEGLPASQSPGNISLYLTDSINAAAAVPSPFTIAVSHSYTSTGDSVLSSITVTCTQAFAPTSANMKLRVAYVETLEYDSPPGTNGETEFHNVVRRMYPDANGTSVGNSWTVGQSETYNVGGPIQNYVDKTGNAFVVAWLQDDNNKAIAQTGKSSYLPLPLDASTKGTSSLACATVPTTAAHTIVLKNNGTSPLTSATISYKVGAAASQSYNWTGNLAVNSSTNVTLPSSNLSAAFNVIVDSVTSVNGQADINPVNSSSRTNITIHNSTANVLPIATSFEGSTLPNGWTTFDANGNGANWTRRLGAGFKSTYSLVHLNYNYPAGEVNYAVFPTAILPAGNKVVAFNVAYAPYQGGENDKLEVVYSTNCGQTWTSVWNKQGDDLKTSAPTTASFVPTVADQWRREYADISGVPDSAIIAFKATSDYGNNVYVDSVIMRSGTAASVGNTAAFASSVTLAPNPTATQSVLTLSLTQGTKLSVQVMDMTGRVVNQLAEQNLSAGTHTFPIATDNLAAGVYNVRIVTTEGVVTQRLSVVK